MIPSSLVVEEVSMASEHSINNISFSEEDRTEEEGHNRSLYVTAFIKNSEFKRALVDTGASTNLVTMKTLKEAKVPQRNFFHHPILMTGFQGSTNMGTPI